MRLPWHSFHFIGIGGIGMSGLAHVLLELGYQISGSDLHFNPLLKRLATQGATIYLGHRPEQIDGAEIIIYSSAIKEDNPEIKAAQEKKLPLLSRGQLLAYLMGQKRGIAITGTHGKTTTSAMIAHILQTAKLKPTAIIGGQINTSGLNAWLGNGRYLVAEADESDGSFLLLHPEIGVFTNIDADHLDYYKNINTIETTFAQFLNQVKETAIICGDDPRLKTLVKNLKIPYLSYGITPGQDIEAREIEFNTSTKFALYIQGKKLEDVFLSLPGKHNVLAALAALTVAKVLNIEIKTAIQGLKNFKGVARRLEIKGEKNKILIIDDYGHHPTEIKIVLAAIKQRWPNRRLITIFQPHRYSRTKALYNSFLTAFEKTDKLILTEIYPASEKPISGITGEWLADGIAQYKTVDYCPDFTAIIDKLKEILRPMDILLTLGAGNIWQIGETILSQDI